MPKRSKTICGVCSEPSQFKFATFYWHWTWPTGDQRSYKQFMDAQCAYQFLQELYDAERREVCDVCDKLIGDEPTLFLWVTMYVPGQERFDWSFDFHNRCFPDFEEHVERNALRLAPRGVGAGGPPPQPRENPWESWSQQGLAPTER